MKIGIVYLWFLNFVFIFTLITIQQRYYGKYDIVFVGLTLFQTWEV